MNAAFGPQLEQRPGSASPSADTQPYMLVGLRRSLASSDLLSEIVNYILVRWHLLALSFGRPGSTPEAFYINHEVKSLV